MNAEPDEPMMALGQGQRVQWPIIRQTCVHGLLGLFRLIHLCQSIHVLDVVPSRPSDL